MANKNELAELEKELLHVIRKSCNFIACATCEFKQEKGCKAISLQAKINAIKLENKEV